MSKTENKIVQEVVADYLKRRENRRSLEAQWQLNINFMMGNQYSYIATSGGIREDEKRYFWQEKEVFNHIAPIVETRISKICGNTPTVTVVPASGDEADIESAKLSKDIINSVANRVNLIDIEKTATTWSEICGTAFYKVIWNTNSGKMVATNELGKMVMLKLKLFLLLKYFQTTCLVKEWKMLKVLFMQRLLRLTKLKLNGM